MINSITLIIITFVVFRMIGHAVKLYFKLHDTDVKTRAVIMSLVKVAKFIIGLLAVLALLEINGIKVTSIVAGVGVAGAVFGLAMQDMFKDVLMGFHIISDHSLSIGEVVRIGQYEGVVMSFTLTTTQLRDVNTGSVVTICNRDISTIEKVCGMYDIEVPLSYDEDPGRVAEVLTGVSDEIRKTEGIETSEYLGIQRYDSSAVVYKVRFTCRPADKWPMWRAAMKELQKGLNAAGLEPPYTQVDVHDVRGGKAGA